MVTFIFTHRNNKKQILFLSALTVFLILSGSSIAAAKPKMLMFNPLRIIFTDRQRSINVHAINTSDEAFTYNISLATMRKGTDGQLYTPKKETIEEQHVKDMIRFSPRRATIQPHTRQVIKVMVRKPKDLPPGEYQTRLSISPEASQPTKRDDLADKSGTISMDVLVASTLPIIIQHDKPPAIVTPDSIALKNMSKSRSGIGAAVKLTRKGELSAFGDLFLTFIPADGSGSTREIGRVIGLAIYLPDTERALNVPLKDITQAEVTGGTIRATFQPNTGVVSRRGQHKGQPISKDFALP